MNPCEAGNVDPHHSEAGVAICGNPCMPCGSANTGSEFALRSKPSILMTICFGWLFLLIRGAFSKRTDRCRDCGAIHRYKSAGSWVALAVLVLLAAAVAAAAFGEMSRQ
jgi:hypothetical protein